MAFPSAQGHLAYFVPSSVIAHNDTRPLCAINTAAANGTHGEFICTVPCTIRQLNATLVLASVNTSVTAKINFTKYTLPSAGGTSTSVGQLAIPDAKAVGTVLYKDLTAGVAFAVGDVMQIAWTVGTGGSVAGEAVVAWNCEYDPEVPGNNSDMVASA
jgi:hypothetical protein